MRAWRHARFAFARIVLAFIVGTTATSSAQAPLPSHQQNPENVVVNTGEVPFDVVVRDKRGRLIKDLTTSDFAVYEDGARQELNSFHLMTPTSAASRPISTNRGDNSKSRANDPGRIKPGKPDTEGGPGISAIALVFDRLSPDARARAREAALSYVGATANKADLVGVFLTDLSVVVLQPYTDDMRLVRQGIENAGVHASSLYTSNNERARALRERISGTPAPGGPSADISAEVRSLQFELLGLERWEELQRDQQGTATTRGLLLIAGSLRQLPGRKAVIFFSEGLSLPPDVLESFRSVINAANRNNVSFYAVDAAGLRAESKTAETNREIASRSNLRMAQESTNVESSTAMTKGMERNEDLLRLNPDSGLGQLADQTGGFLITDTNDIKSKLEKVDEELHTYYKMSYVPKNQAYDGHFRKIEVRVKRPGATVQSRKGYYAINGAFSSPVLSYEVPGLAVLSNGQHPQAFTLHAAAFTFPQPGRTGLVPIMVEAPMSAFTMNVDQAKNSYKTDFSIVILLKDRGAQVVQKLSNQYHLSGPLEKLDDAKHGQVLFYREADVAPGSYVLEVVAYDAPTGRASVRLGNIEVLQADEGKLRMSSIVILKGAEKAVAADQKESNPFHVADMVLYPNMGETIHRARKQLAFFFTVYTPGATRAVPKMTIELWQQKHELAQIPGEMSTPDEAGRIQYMAGLPLEKIPAGSYELRITINDGTTSVARSEYFTVED